MSQYRCIITSGCITTELALPFVSDDAHGATCHFLGIVRNHNEGKIVMGINYEVCQPLAMHMLNDIAEKLIKQDPFLKIYIAHFEGYLPVGGVSLLVSTSSPHRNEAYHVNRSIVEEIKHRVPIWKKEYYTDNSVHWVKGCKIE